MAELKVTPASAWALPTSTVELPSGNVVVLLDKLPAYKLMRTGQLTQELLQAFAAAQAGELEDVQKGVELVDLICTTMFVEPTVTVDGKDGTVSINLLDEGDIDFVIDRAFGGAPDPSFLDESDGSEGGGGVEGVVDQPVPDAGDGAGDNGKPDAGRGAGRKAPARRAKAKP